MKKSAVFLLLSLCSSVILSGAEPDLTEGLWHVSIPENSGEIKPMGPSFRFKTDGTAELVYSEKVLKLKEQMRRDYKKRTGKDIQEPRIDFRWERQDNLLKLHGENSRLKFKRTEVYVIGKYPGVLMPQNRKQLILLARDGAKLLPEQAKKLFKRVEEATRDTFADKLKLPENVRLAEPEKELSSVHFFNRSHWRDAPEKSFQQEVVSAIGKGPKLADDADCRIPALEKLLARPETEAVFLQYLACNSEWRLYRDPLSGLHAVRYFRYPDGTIAASLNQFYAHFLPTGPNGKKVGDPALEFQFRFEIGLDGRAWNSSPLFPRDKTEHRGNTWHTRFSCGKALVNIVDQSNFPGRQMTAAALARTEKEFSQLPENLKDWKKCLPADSFRRGGPDLILRNGIQGGIYEAAVWCNPGEKGSIYLKAFEITKGTPLSVERLKMSSNCIPGWSDDPREQFFSAMNFTIYEGRWEQYYGARFEIWFRPDSGGPERKLFEKNYKIQGWER
ncbi:MAG: hypothetical protein E7055_04510 [Lentisphaerae bacterium]|nr:hypothetical protein [Lentisphaerota bacterium]